VIDGMTDASTTRRPSRPWTRMVDGSTTESSSTPIRHEHDGWSAVSASRATHARISTSVETAGPGEISPPSNGEKASCRRIALAQRIASGHSRRSCSVER
jgi:hypothetical protein